MKIKKFALAIFTSLFASSITACGVSQTNSAIPSDAQFVKIEAGKSNLDPNKPVVYVADMQGTSKGQKGGASFSVKINFPESGFKTKASSDGSNTASIQTLRVNLATNPTMPFSSRVLTTPTDGILITRSGLTSGTAAATVVFTNVAAGTYYATVAAFNKPIGSVSASTGSTSEGIVAVNNASTPYSASDSGARIATSSNSATVNATTLALTFSSGTNLTVGANIEVKGATVDTVVTPTDSGTIGSLSAS